ncbi:uncharacterized protein NPIL_468001 [Nephila pilipes]|uniref:Uncharacterized protein n=1 Tax=Nephila pilipes TaxID=299642 RepID=A0A8X6TIG4_NEPPI|nr:uncharacterized protein NPIL_468001 [Nephila pilipes]
MTMNVFHNYEWKRTGLSPIMNMRFWPSLQLIASVRIARGLLRNFEFNYIFPDFLFVSGFISNQYMHETVSSLNLQNIDLENRTLGVLEALEREMVRWCSCHCVFLMDASPDYWNRIQWYSHGIINKLETARAFIRDENISIGQRFNLACAYYLEVDVRTLFENMSSGYRQYFLTKRYENRSRTFWLDALQTRTPLNWSQICNAVHFDRFSVHDRRNFFHRNFLGLLQLFPKLENLETRFRSIIIFLESEELHPFELYLCLCKTEDYQLDNMFNRLSMEQRFSVCKSFLHLPLQGLFLDILERFSKNMPAKFYLELFLFILFKNFVRNLFDYDYVDLMKNIWASIPNYAKTEIEQNAIYVHLRQVLDNGRVDFQSLIALNENV